MLTLSENVTVGVTVVVELTLTVALDSLYLTPPDDTVDDTVVVLEPLAVNPPIAVNVLVDARLAEGDTVLPATALTVEVAVTIAGKLASPKALELYNPVP